MGPVQKNSALVCLSVSDGFETTANKELLMLPGSSVLPFPDHLANKWHHQFCVDATVRQRAVMHDSSGPTFDWHTGHP